MRYYGGCGCNTQCGCETPSCNPCNTKELGTIIYIQNSWNIPAIGENAEVDVPLVKTMQVGASIWNPTYGQFQIVSFNGATGKLVIKNNGYVYNSVSGTTVEANTKFLPIDPAFKKVGSWTPTMPTVGSLVVTITNIAYANYKVIEDECSIDLYIDFSLAGSGNTIAIVPPFIGKEDHRGPLLCKLVNDTAFGILAPAHFTSDNLIYVRRQDLASFDISDSQLQIKGSYTLEPQ